MTTNATSCETNISAEDQQFVDALNAYLNMDGDTAERRAMRAPALADAMQVSRPTLHRWLRGRNLPYPPIRAALLRSLDNLLARK